MLENRMLPFVFGFVFIASLLVFSIPAFAQQGPPDDTPGNGNIPDDPGKPEGTPGGEGKPENVGPETEHGAPEGVGKPDDTGPPDDTPGIGNIPDDPGKPEGTPGGEGKPENVGPETEHGAPEGVGKPDDTGPPEGVPAGGFGGIVATENIVGIEELSTLNVGGSKNAGMHIGPRALGTPLLEISSDSVCGDTLCDEPMSIQEKIQMYLQSRGLTVPER